MSVTCRTAVILCCHAVYKALDFDAPFSDASWALLPHQTGDPPGFRAHMRAAIARVANDPDALLIISGGQTRLDAGPVSEAASYWRLLEHDGWHGHSDVRPRAVLEEYATDSFENVLFGIARFHEIVSRYPERLELVTWTFKQRRMDHHLAALRWPPHRAAVIAAGNPDALMAAEAGERAALDAFRADPYGVHPPLATKRAARNPFRRQHGYRTSCPELEGLLDYGGTELYAGALPWARL